MTKFELISPFKPQGDQIKAIDKLVDNFNNGHLQQILLGATGTGKTFTIANVINKVNKKTLVLAHNKTLAGQLYGELAELFPNNKVQYFISYYDYYQPEAYVVRSDTFIEKDASINEEIEEMRHKAVEALLSDEEDVIIVASVSCIYGIGDPNDYKYATIFLKTGMNLNRDDFLRQLITIQYTRNDYEFARGTFRVRGDIVEVMLASTRLESIRISFFGNEIDSISIFDVITNKVIKKASTTMIFPSSLFMTNQAKIKESLSRIRLELNETIANFNQQNKLLEAQRIQQRTNHDLEMIEELGYCGGIENYSRHLTLKDSGEPPATLLDFFGDDFLMIIDESHVTIPQVKGMYKGDRSRKQTLVDFGFRLPSALDNRPLTFAEFEKRLDKVVYLSATPDRYELDKKLPIVEQIIRPTYLLDPVVEVRPKLNQMDDLYFEIKDRVAKNERVLVTTLTIRMSEELSNYFKELGLKVGYLHSEIKALERIEILRDLRTGKYDCLVGINLLREGLDLPEVSLVAILDADKPGFLRSEKSLIQTIGRAARNINGKVIMYAEVDPKTNQPVITPAMKIAIDETNRRRKLQAEFNAKYHTTPKQITKGITSRLYKDDVLANLDTNILSGSKELILKEISNLESKMRKAAKDQDFESAIEIRDIIIELKAKIK